jgi:hypothetical protein
VRRFLAFPLVSLLFATPALGDFAVSFGVSWDSISLQSVLDAEYGVGVIDAATDYEGYLPGDADPAYWEDLGVDGLIIREIAGFQNQNVFGWYKETLAGAPVIDGVDDGIIFTGPMAQGSIANVVFPGGTTQFGFYLNPNGPGAGGNFAQEPEHHFTNRFYNDIGPTGSGALHVPLDGDAQVLIYNITHLRGGVPTFVLAWEDIDSGCAIAPAYHWDFTDNDYQDLVVEITAISTVKSQDSSFGSIKSLYRD